MREERSKPGGEALLIGVVLITALAALFYFFSQRQSELRTGPTGFEGLTVWLNSEGQNARSFSGGWSLAVSEIGLLIIPLFDTEPDTERVAPQSAEGYIYQQDEYDLTLHPILEKIEMVPTLVVLPKWRSGMRLTQLAHPELLVERQRIKSLLEELLGEEVTLGAGAKPFTKYPVNGDQSAVIYAAQTISARRCTPLIGTAEAMILGECRSGYDRVLILADPDLMNNHGLALGDNATIVRDLIAGYAEGMDVVVDYSPRNWLTENMRRSSTRERTWADFMRFFGPPFTVIWLTLGAAFALLLWRGGLRFGPPLKPEQSEDVSKVGAITARARLMLLTGKAGALAQDYAQARLAIAATKLFGATHGREYARREKFLTFVQRRCPELAPPLAGALDKIDKQPSAAAPRQAMGAIDDLDKVLERIIDDT
jgi:hypothetical protein